MDIRFQSATAPADAELAAHARRSLLLLQPQHRSDRVVGIDVELVDAAGRVSRCDHEGIVSAKRHGQPAATGADVGADVHLATDRAADRAGRQAERPLRQVDGSPAPRTMAVAA